MVPKASLGYASTVKCSSTLREPQWSFFCDVINQWVVDQPCHIFHLYQQSTLSQLFIAVLIIKSECLTHAVIGPIILTVQIGILFLPGSKKLGQDHSWHSGWMSESKTSDPSSSLGYIFSDVYFSHYMERTFNNRQQKQSVSFGWAVVRNLRITPEGPRSSPTKNIL